MSVQSENCTLIGEQQQQKCWKTTGVKSHNVKHLMTSIQQLRCQFHGSALFEFMFVHKQHYMLNTQNELSESVYLQFIQCVVMV